MIINKPSATVMLLSSSTLAIAASAQITGIKLGCLSSPPTSNLTVIDNIVNQQACTVACSQQSASYAYYTESSLSSSPLQASGDNNTSDPETSSTHCSCSNSTAPSDTYVYANNTSADCNVGSTWFLGLETQNQNGSYTYHTTCPYIGPGSSTSFINYTYLSLLPSSEACFEACNLTGTAASVSSSSLSSSAAAPAPGNGNTGRVALISPSSAGVEDRGSSWACACADGINRQTFAGPCGQESWYVVTVNDVEESSMDDSGVSVRQKEVRRSRRL